MSAGNPWEGLSTDLLAERIREIARDIGRQTAQKPIADALTAAADRMLGLWFGDIQPKPAGCAWCAAGYHPRTADMHHEWSCDECGGTGKCHDCSGSGRIRQKCDAPERAEDSYRLSRTLNTGD